MDGGEGGNKRHRRKHFGGSGVGLNKNTHNVKVGGWERGDVLRMNFYIASPVRGRQDYGGLLVKEILKKSCLMEIVKVIKN